MAVIDQGMPMGAAPPVRGRTTAAVLSIAGGIAGLVVLVLMVAWPDGLLMLGGKPSADPVVLSLFAVAIIFMLGGGLLTLPRMGLGGAIVLTGTLFWLAGCIVLKNLGWAPAAPIVLSFLGALTG